MRILKSIILSIISIVLGVGSIFLLQMFLNADQIKLLITGTLFTAIVLVIVLTIKVLRKGIKENKFIKTQFDVFLLIMTMFLIIVGGAYTSIYNLAMYEAFGNDMTFPQKLENRKILKQHIKGRRKQDDNLALYIKSLGKEKIGNISLYYPKDIDASYSKSIKDAIPLAEELAHGIYGELDKDPLKVIIYNEDEWNKLEDINTELVQGFFDGRSIRIRGFLKNQVLWHMEENFIHEYAHYALDLYTYKNDILRPIPSWFNEGVSEYISVYKKDRTYSLEYIRNPVDLRELQTDEEFWGSIDEEIKDGSEEDFYDPYVYSYYMIDSLVDLKGEEIITDILLTTKEMDFYEAFQQEVGVAIEEYQAVNLVEYVNKKID